ncbi:non-canonical purine NTP pyrophosphatase [Marininema halotolerans]|uniref:XTP/dITP diphosphohydrolase n=1 Tax=Marininema halotolerans TaxID=1155944 RepID=A0A1I6NXH9_9BACL|nr:non-canonical purine NTP pyrophosphatase [Marininema halotolerans]SFS32624.1 XTP/dITP diphosphohydrolase [Marininema halotolerans]
MILPFATMNEDKLKEAKRVLSPHGIQVTSLPVPLVEPDTGSIESVAWEKLKQVRERGYERAMVDDAGIFFAAYPFFPGILTKRIFNRIGYKGMLKLLEGESRQAWFEGAMGVLWDGETVVFSAKTPGEILEHVPHHTPEEPGFPFNRIFVPEGEHRTFGEMSMEEREAYSYRGQVLKKVAHWLIQQGSD